MRKNSLDCSQRSMIERSKSTGEVNSVSARSSIASSSNRTEPDLRRQSAAKWNASELAVGGWRPDTKIREPSRRTDGGRWASNHMTTPLTLDRLNETFSLLK